MRAKAISITAAIVLGGVMLLVGLINLVNANFGTDFLRAIGSLDPGLHVARTLGSVVLGTIYGFVEGLIVGYIFGAIYGAMMRPQQRPLSQSLNRAA